MSRTKHHRSQKSHPHHCGWDYGGKYKHNKHYGGGYGSFARHVADKERRNESKAIIKTELEYLWDDIVFGADLDFELEYYEGYYD